MDELPRHRTSTLDQLPSTTMIQLKTLLSCIDNSGASVVECVNVLKKKRAATIGDRIVVVVQKQRAAGSEGSGTALANKVRRGDIRHAVIVRVKKELQRVDGTVVRFGDNACVLVNKSGDPIGTRMTGVVGQELRDKQWSKILSLAPMNV
ncbi:54S ribosomal protein L38 [Penicillium waksmanii]|uniref:54S ribosomal protein L38 n=1 Tax=Penicillium waksmanii TaxID=69791 RepID=UPI00254790E9|nr:54S ribosomal protein L38 [Penicillium waksmanii]KAJ5988425.1 54S ribosomal protein L38 [Penicillium waksmanii]